MMNKYTKNLKIHKSNENLTHNTELKLRSKSIEFQLVSSEDQSSEVNDLDCISSIKDEDDGENCSTTTTRKNKPSKFINYLEERPLTYCDGQALQSLDANKNKTSNNRKKFSTDNISNPIVNISSYLDKQEEAQRARGYSLAESKSSSLRPLFRSFPKLRPSASNYKSELDSQSETASQNSNVSSEIAHNYYRSSAVIMNTSLSAIKNLEAQLGQELAAKLIFDQSNSLKDNYNELASSVSMNSISNRSSNETESHDEPVKKSTKSPEEIGRLRKQKACEYKNIEEKQAKLIELLHNNIYDKFLKDNKDNSLCDHENMSKIFFVIVELSKFSELVHGEVASKLGSRLANEWNEKPYFGDILIERYQFYRVYSSILRRFPDCQIALSNMLKKKAFATYIKQLLESEAIGLENVNRIDILLDRLVDFPRRVLQLLESYLKNLDKNTTEYNDIEKVAEIFKNIFLESNDSLNKTMNFQQCYSLQYMIDFDSKDVNLFEGNRFLIKQGPIYKVSKRSGETQLRHLTLFSDMLLVCKVDKLKKNLKLNYNISTQDMKLIENTLESNVSSDENEKLKFRLISSQNNQFLADSKKHKEDWLKAFRKASNIKIIQTRDTNDLIDFSKIGVNPPPWIPDPQQTECSGCKETFSTFRRRHHCRTCGKIYCNACCNDYTHVQFSNKKERVCKSCFYYLDARAPRPTNNHSNKNINFNNNNNTTTPSPPSIKVSPPEVPLKNDKFRNELNERINKNHNETNKSTEIEQNLNELNLSTIPLAETPIVVFRRESHTTTKEDESSSSSLTEEQIQFVGKILERPNSEEMSDELDTNDNSDVSSSRNEDASLSVNTEMNDSLNDTATSITENSSSSSPRAFLRKGFTKKALKIKSSSAKDLNDSKLNSSFGRVSSSGQAPKSDHDRKIVLADYGYLSKIATRNADLTLSNEIIERNNLERKYLILFSDNTLGISSNSNEAPNFLIQLGLYNLANLDEKTFELVKINQPDANHSSSDSIPEAIERRKLSVIKNMFELNYEIKFTNKDIKSKWCESILNHSNCNST